MISTPNIGWLTGLLEGEGSFLTSGRAIMIAVNMVDRDIIERAAYLLTAHVYGPLDRSFVKPHYQPIWRAQVKGPRAAAWMMTMYSQLGRRRRDQVRRAIEHWRAMRYVRISPLARQSIVERWRAGERNKVRLAKQSGVCRETVYRVLDDEVSDWRFEDGCRDVTMFEIAWLAGLVEGEGNISINGRSLTLRVGMTDFDVVNRAALLMGATAQPKAVAAGRRPMWLAQIKGELAASWIMTIYPWLGLRRRQQARASLAHWKTQGRGVVSPSLAATIVTYRAAGYAQTQIMRMLGVSKSSVYRHTVGRLPRRRITRQRMPAEAPSAVPS